jgi:predicted patatin/cPLA2 family phospholipase
MSGRHISEVVAQWRKGFGMSQTLIGFGGPANDVRTGPQSQDVGPAVGAHHPIIGLMLDRAARGYRRGEQSDGAVLALAIEGGGMRGAVSAGMCLVLEQAGLIDAVDVIYGTSSGALNGSFTATGQAALGCTNYIDTASRRFANPLRILCGRRAVDFDLLFEDVIRQRKPYDELGMQTGPPFRALAVDLATSELRVLADMADANDLLEAVRVSCALPLLSEPPMLYRGMRLADGGFLESMPYTTAFAQGATHVLVLRSRPASYRKGPYARALIEVMRRAGHPALAAMMGDRAQRYNTEAAHLQAIADRDGTLFQIAPAAESAKVSQLEHSEKIIRSGMTAGANAVAQALGLADVDVMWQPNIYART